MDFNEKDMFSKLEKMSEEDCDAAPFGIVRMNDKDEVSSYNKYESELAGLSPKEVMGKNFFVEVAPCSNNFMVAHRFDAEKEIDDTLDYMFTYKLAPVRVQLRLLKQASSSNRYLLVRKA